MDSAVGDCCWCMIPWISLLESKDELGMGFDWDILGVVECIVEVGIIQCGWGQGVFLEGLPV